jgi:hypothetical protein
MLQTRVAMNEYLLKYMISEDIQNEEGIFYLKYANPIPSFHIEEKEVDIDDFEGYEEEEEDW